MSKVVGLVIKIITTIVTILDGYGGAKVEFWNAVIASVASIQVLWIAFSGTELKIFTPTTYEFYVTWCLLVAALAKIFGLITNRLRWRKYSAIALMFLWLTIFMERVVNAPDRPAPLLLLVFVAMCSYTFLRLKIYPVKW